VNDPVGLSIKLFINAWRTICAGAREYADEAAGGVHYVFSGLPIAFFNIALATGRDVSAATLSASGREACDRASKHDAPWLFVVTDETLVAGTDPAAALEPCGLAPLMPLTGMIARQIAPPANVPPELRLARAQDDGACSALLRVNGLAYGMDLEAGKAILGKHNFWSRHFPALGLVKRKPVSAAAVLMVDEYRYVALVATDPEFQRRGYGDVVMRHALELSEQVHGHLPSMLHATAAGRPMYERMGYKRVTEHTVFIEKRFLTGH
jgi:GNAT superfamily N-acetyltransferase